MQYTLIASNSNIVGMSVVASLVSTPASKSVTVKFYSATATAADPDSGDTLLMKFELSNSTAP